MFMFLNLLFFEDLFLRHKCWSRDVKHVEGLIICTPDLQMAVDTSIQYSV